MKNNLNILHIFASAGWGGGEKYAFELACALRDEGMSVALVSRPSEIIAGKAAAAGITHNVLPLKGIIDVVSAVRLARIMRTQNTDIIHVHNFKDAFTAVYAKYLAGIDTKIVVTRHLVRRGKNSLLYRWLYRHLDKIVFVSHLARTEFLEGVSFLPAAKTEVIYNSIDTQLVANEAENLRSHYALSDNTVLLGFTGRVVAEKGCHVVVEALAKMNATNVAAIFIGIGDSIYLQELQALAHERGVADRVFFYGYSDNIAALVSQVDIGLVPSVVKEAFCLSAVEYMFAAKPVIATDNGAQQEYIRNGENGILVPPSDVDALAAAIDRLVADPELRLAIGTHAQMSARKLFTYDRFRHRMMSLYASLWRTEPAGQSVLSTAPVGDSVQHSAESTR